nr:hypothetical protein [Bacilli bacterium]
FEIESSKELASQRDIHGNLKICAKATIESGESTEICRSINKLDLDYPETPTIDAAGGYPVITEYGIVTGLITVTPEPSNELTPYISFNGTEWIPYEVGMSALGNTIYAKVVKNGTGLESDITEITTTASADALNSNAYDGNRSTSDTFGYYNQDSHVKYIYVDENMAGKKISVYMSCGQYTNRGQIYFLDKDNKELQHNQGPESTSEVILTVPAGTTKIKFYQGNNQLYIYEIKFYDTPGITNSFTYPTITQSGVVAGHNKINITYASTSVQKLYKIGDGEWQNYTGTVNLPVGQTIYAKGINTYGIETEVSSYLSAAVANALTGNAYDGNRSTSDTFGYYNQSGHNKYIFIDESMIGKKISVYMSAYSPSTRGQIYFLDKDNKELQHSQGPESTGEVKFTVPAGTAKIKFYQGSQTIYVYEIGPAN